MNWISVLVDRDCAFRRWFILLTCAVLVNGCSSIVKQQYLRHLSTTMKPAPRESDTDIVPRLAVADASTTARR